MNEVIECHCVIREYWVLWIIIFIIKLLIIISLQEMMPDTQYPLMT